MCCLRHLALSRPSLPSLRPSLPPLPPSDGRVRERLAHLEAQRSGCVSWRGSRKSGCSSWGPAGGAPCVRPRSALARGGHLARPRAHAHISARTSRALSLACRNATARMTRHLFIPFNISLQPLTLARRCPVEVQEVLFPERSAAMRARLALLLAERKGARAPRGAGRWGADKEALVLHLGRRREHVCEHCRHRPGKPIQTSSEIELELVEKNFCSLVPNCSVSTTPTPPVEWRPGHTRPGGGEASRGGPSCGRRSWCSLGAGWGCPRSGARRCGAAAALRAVRCCALFSLRARRVRPERDKFNRGGAARDDQHHCRRPRPHEHARAECGNACAARQHHRHSKHAAANPGSEDGEGDGRWALRPRAGHPLPPPRPARLPVRRSTMLWRREEPR